MKVYVEKLQSGLRRLNRVPTYSAPKRVTGIPSTDGAREWDEPEYVNGHGRHKPFRGRVDTIREVPAGYAEDLAAIDAKRAELRRQLAALDAEERLVIDLAYSSGNPVTVMVAMTETERLIAAREARKVDEKSNPVTSS